jgi:hypothetical protein
MGGDADLVAAFVIMFVVQTHYGVVNGCKTCDMGAESQESGTSTNFRVVDWIEGWDIAGNRLLPGQLPLSFQSSAGGDAVERVASGHSWVSTFASPSPC